MKHPARKQKRVASHAPELLIHPCVDVRIRADLIIEERVEAGIRLGWRRLWKYRDNEPSGLGIEQCAVETMTRAIMELLDEVFAFDGDTT